MPSYESMSVSHRADLICTDVEHEEQTSGYLDSIILTI